MFRSRKYPASQQKDTNTNSSLDSGNASIKRPTSNTYPEPEYNEHEIIDLQAPTPQQDLTIESMSAVIAAAVQMSAAGGAPSSLSLGSASILQPFSKTEQQPTKRRFSTRLFSNPWKKPTVSSSGVASPTSPMTPALEPSSPFDSTSSIDINDDNSSQGSPRTSSVSTNVDDGRDELLYRGIQIKEIKTTLKTLVISDQVRCPMPEVRLERPGFARINY
jgi:hypothetical protein